MLGAMEQTLIMKKFVLLNNFTIFVEMKRVDDLESRLNGKGDMGKTKWRKMKWEVDKMGINLTPDWRQTKMG